MQSKIKKLALFTIVAVVVLSVAGVAKCGAIESDSAADAGHILTLRLPNLAFLNGPEYHSAIENICLTVFVVLLVVFRALLIRKASS